MSNKPNYPLPTRKEQRSLERLNVQRQREAMHENNPDRQPDDEIPSRFNLWDGYFTQCYGEGWEEKRQGCGPTKQGDCRICRGEQTYERIGDYGIHREAG